MTRTSSLFGRIIMIAAAASLVAACSGGGDKKPKNKYDDEGRERVSVLTSTQLLDADEALSGITVTLPPAYRNLNWAQPGGNEAHLAQHLEIGETLSRAWSRSFGRGNQDYERMVASPVSAEGKVFAVDSRGDVAAVSLSDGSPLWTAEIRSEERSDVGFGGGVTYAGGVVYATSGYGFVVALDASTGAERWRFDASVPFRGAPTVTAGRVIAVTHDNRIVALNIDDGSLVWDQVGIAESAGMLGAATPASDGQTVVAALSSGELMAMRAGNGRIVWQDALTASQRLTPLATLADVDGHPVIDRGKVYAVSLAGTMVAIDMRSGERSWETDIASVSMPWIAGNFAYMTTIDGQVACIALGDGRVRWVAQLQRFTNQEKRKGLISWNGPVLAGDRLLVASSHGYLVSVSPYTGEVLSATELPAGVTTDAIVVDGTYIVITNDGKLVAYR